jgi:hypothetical protein
MCHCQSGSFSFLGQSQVYIPLQFISIHAVGALAGIGARVGNNVNDILRKENAIIQGMKHHSHKHQNPNKPARQRAKTATDQ